MLLLQFLLELEGVDGVGSLEFLALPDAFKHGSFHLGLGPVHFLYRSALLGGFDDSHLLLF